MDLKTAKEIEQDVISVFNGEEVTQELIDKLRLNLMKDGELIPDECSFLSHNTGIKFTFRKVQGIEGEVKAFGIRYKNVGIELGQILTH